MNEPLIPRLLQRPGWVAVLLSVATVALYSPAVSFDFLLYDDNYFIYEEPLVRGGLSARSIHWALTSTWGFWFPLTRLSHILDAQLWGMAPGGHHLTSVLLHAANVALVFAIFRRLVGSIAVAALSSGLFSAHPLNVETVAWLSERKEVLCGTLFLAALATWLGSDGTPSPRRVWATTGLYAAALAAKPMAITLPGVLLLLDAWPRARLLAGGRAAWSCVREKWPLFVVGGAFIPLTWYAQHSIHATGDPLTFPLGARVANALVSALDYLRLAVFPCPLSPFYPHPYGSIPWWRAASAALAVGAVTAALVRVRRRRPHLAVGWLWWLGMLVPVIGLVQIGRQAMADHYAYLPTLGLLVAGAVELEHRGWARRWPRAAGAVAALCLAAAAWATSRQLTVWKDTQSVFEHARDVTVGSNWLAEQTLGALAARDGRLAEAEQHLRAAHEALGTDPLVRAKIWERLAVVLDVRGARAEAMEELAAAARARPASWGAHYELGAALAASGRPDEAAAAFRAALALEPRLDAARRALAKLARDERRHR